MLELQSPIGNLVMLSASDLEKVRVYLRHGWRVIRFDGRRVTKHLMKFGMAAREAAVQMAYLTEALRKSEAALSETVTA